MSGTLVRLRSGSAVFKVPVPRREDRWVDLGTAGRRRATTATALVLVTSAILHGALVATAFLDRSGPPVKAPDEIPVEVVQEMPKPPEPAKKAAAATPKAAAPKTAEAPPPPKAAEPPALKPTLPPAEPPKLEPPKPEPPKLEQPKPQPAKVEPPKPEPTKAEPAPHHSEAELRALEDELTQLKAEHDALQAERAAARPKPQAPSGLGPLPESFRAVALPGQGDDGEAVSYSQIVFSQLAKAMEIGGKMGVPGTSGVHFLLDANGGLIKVQLAHSSGITALDEEAVAIVRRAAPFPAPPQGAQRDFSANVSFVPGANK